MQGTMQQVRPGVWKIRIYLRRNAKGQPQYRTETFHGSERAAKTRRAELVTKYVKGNRAPGTETLGALLDQWIEHFGETWSPTTLRANKQVIESTVKPALGDVKLSRLTALDLDRLYKDRKQLGNKPATIRRAHALISRALDQGKRWGMVDTNVALDASPESIERSPVTAPPTQDVLDFTTACDRAGQAWLGAFLRLEAYTGMRRGELCALRWADVDLDAGTITVSKSLYAIPGGGWATKTPKTRAGHRVIPIGPGAVSILKWHLEDVLSFAVKHPETDQDTFKSDVANGFVFSWAAGATQPYMPDSVTQATRRIAKDCGIHMTPHMLRHWAATQAISAGMAPNAVAAMLGHADASVTLRVYTSQPDATQQREMAAVLDQAMDRKTLPTRAEAS